MRWILLKENICPKCETDFGFLAYSEPDFVNCPKKTCDFRISHKRFSEIVNSQVTAELQEKLEREYPLMNYRKEQD